jgi:hypothetical protein
LRQIVFENLINDRNGINNQWIIRRTQPQSDQQKKISADNISRIMLAASVSNLDNTSVGISRPIGLLGNGGGDAHIMPWFALHEFTAIGDHPGFDVRRKPVRVGDAIPLKASLRKNKHLLYWSDQHGQTPLHLAALHACLDHFEVEAFQLAIRDNVFETPMHYAALSGCLNQIAGEITPEMLMMINWSSETVLDLFTKKKQPTSASLENVIWEAQFITDPTKRTWENVTQHIGIHR